MLLAVDDTFYPQVLLEAYFYKLWMLYYQRIDVNKTSKSKKCIIC